MSTESLLHRLAFAKTNRARWDVFFATNNTCIQDRVLYVILRHTQDNLERWRVFDNTFRKDLKETALIAILVEATFQGDIREMWVVHECAHSPELKLFASLCIHLNDHLPPDTSEEKGMRIGKADTLTHEEIREREIEFAEKLDDPDATPSSLYEVFFYTVSDAKRREAFVKALKQKPVII